MCEYRVGWENLLSDFCFQYVRYEKVLLQNFVLCGIYTLVEDSRHLIVIGNGVRLPLYKH